MTKVWTALAVLGLVILAAIWLVVTPAPTENASMDAEGPVFNWNISEVGESPVVPGMPRSAVSVALSDKTYPLGEFDGSCFEIEGSGWALYEGEKSGVICWWAGGGSEVGVFEENGTFVVKRGDLDEGSAETPGFRGNFRTILTIES